MVARVVASLAVVSMLVGATPAVAQVSQHGPIVVKPFPYRSAPHFATFVRKPR